MEAYRSKGKTERYKTQRARVKRLNKHMKGDHGKYSEGKWKNMLEANARMLYRILINSEKERKIALQNTKKEDHGQTKKRCWKDGGETTLYC